MTIEEIKKAADGLKRYLEENPGLDKEHLEVAIELYLSLEKQMYALQKGGE